MTAAASAALPPLHSKAGRVCPADYFYKPEVFARAPDFEARALYVAGGLYGNHEALAEIERLASRERTSVTIVFNGDFHWFDANPEWFAEVERGVSRHLAMRGNVETELARPEDIGAGCGCAYPEGIDADTVGRSNAILALLRDATPPPARAALAHLPMHFVAQVGGLRVGIAHGDATALAGWRFAADALDQPESQPWLNDIRARAKVDVFASTHTCLAALRDFWLPTGQLTVINNGAAGMPNFSGTRFGVITRLGVEPSPHRTLYGLERGGVHIDALPIEYDDAAFTGRFLAHWPPGTPAHASYYGRIVNGPAYTIAKAAS